MEMDDIMHKTFEQKTIFLSIANFVWLKPG